MLSFVAIRRDEDGQQRELTSYDEVVASVRSRTGVTWVHANPRTTEDGRDLVQDFGLHPLAVEDALNQGYQRPKIEEYDGLTFMLVQGIDYAATSEVVTTAELDVFVAEHWVISCSQVEMPTVAHLLDEMRSGQQRLPESAALVAYTLVDALVDNMLPVIERMEDVTDLIEDEVLSNAHPALLQHLVNLKRSVMLLNRVAAPQGQIFAQIAQGGRPGLASVSTLFRDIHDHQTLLAEQIQDLRERASHAVDMYHSALSIKQNETMRILSIVASIFLPLTLLAGIYGMNFDYMPELRWAPAYFIVVGFMAVVVIAGMYLLFGRHLLGWGRDRMSGLASFALEPPVVSDAAREATRLRAWVMGNGRNGRAEPPERAGDDQDLAP